VALTVVLLTSAGLLLRSLANAASVDPGFDPARVLAFDLSLPDGSYPDRPAKLAFSARLLERLRAVPGIEQAGTGMSIPFAGGGYGEYFRRPDRTDVEAVIGRLDFVSPGYLEALGTRLLAGRRLADADNRIEGPPVIVISEATARMFFKDVSPIGQPIVVAATTWTVIGVVGDVADRRLDTPRGPFGYAPAARNQSQLSVAVRTTLSPMSLVETVRGELARIDAGVALANPRALDEAMAGSMLQRKTILGLIGVFALAALTLAGVGLYGVLAYAVATRQREFGIRIAFGAERQDLVRQVLGRGLRMMSVGLVVGLAAAIGVARLLATELYEVSGSDPLVMAGTVATIVGVTVLACCIPAWRAARVEPVVALRST
jgi:predicted permease